MRRPDPIAAKTRATSPRGIMPTPTVNFLMPRDTTPMPHSSFAATASSASAKAKERSSGRASTRRLVRTPTRTKKRGASPEPLCQQVGKVRIDHPAIGIDHAEPVAERLPAVAVRVCDLLFRHEGALIQQRPAASLV